MTADPGDEHIKYMECAYREAQKAFAKGETPVGAVIVKDGKVIARGGNEREAKNDPLAHAELTAIKKASRKLASWRLSGCDIYVTLEPCPMCAGAIIQSRIGNLYYGAADPKAGACGSAVDLFAADLFNHRVQIHPGLLEDKCSSILKKFFAMLRAKEIMK